MLLGPAPSAPFPQIFLLFEREYLVWLQQRFSILFKHCTEIFLTEVKCQARTEATGNKCMLVLHVGAGLLPRSVVMGMSSCPRHPHEGWSCSRSKADLTADCRGRRVTAAAGGHPYSISPGGIDLSSLSPQKWETEAVLRGQAAGFLLFLPVHHGL